MTEGSHCFGPLAAAAATEQVMTEYKMPPGSWHIYKIRVGYANIVNAKEVAGYVRIIVAGQNGNYYYVVGHGAGGATNSNGMAAQDIDCAINADGGAAVNAYIYNAEAIKDAVISIHFRSGSGRNVWTYKCGGAGSDVTAGTELTIGTMTILKDGTIREIRFTGSGVVDALAETAKLTLEIPGQEGIPHEYAVGHGTAGATLSNNTHCDVIKLPHGIPVQKNTVITAKVLNLVTTGSALLSCAVSIQVV
jgi:hypothetical protein